MHCGYFKNTVAKDIDEFKESVKTNGGYYISRYEAGDNKTSNNRNSSSSQTIIPVFKEDQTIYNYITQANAAILMRNLYNNQSDKYENDLINSYAWDTAIVYIQEFSGDKDYSRQGGLQSQIVKTGQSTDGINKDERCHIFDMAGNVSEWTTETNNYGGYPCTYRGNNSRCSSERQYQASQNSFLNTFGFRRKLIFKKLTKFIEDF